MINMINIINKMDYSDYYIIKYNSTVFKPNTVVKYITCTYSGKCYLIADLNEPLKREWIMAYSLYPFDKNKLSVNDPHIPEYDEIAVRFINNNYLGL